MSGSKNAVIMEEKSERNNWVEYFCSLESFGLKNARLCSWVREIYRSDRVILFYRSSNRTRYVLSRHLGLSKKILNDIVFYKEKFIDLKWDKNSYYVKNGTTALKDWKFFSSGLKRNLKKAGINRILPLWCGKSCVGGVLFNSSLSKKNDAALSFESSVSELAYLLEIAFVEQLNERLNWQKKVLLDVGSKLSATGDLQSILDQIIDSVHEVIPYDAAGIFLVNMPGKTLECKAIRGYPNNLKELIDAKVGKGIIGWSIKKNKEAIVPDVSQDSRYIAARRETKSELVVPIVFKDKVIGAFNLENNRKHFFRFNHLEILRSIAAQTAVVLNNSRMLYEALKVKELEKELDIAKSIQKAFLPKKIPVYDGYDFSAFALPSLTIGGDLYDLMKIDENKIAVAIGDVVGKGIPGALLMAMLSAAFKGHRRIDNTTDQIIENLNNSLYNQTESNKFATFFYGVLDCEKDIFKFTNAGHNPPILVRSDGAYSFLTAGGPLLGFMPDNQYISEQVKLNSGDLILLYTDGLSEALNPRENEFGEKRIVKTLIKNRNLTAPEISDSLLSEIYSFTKKSHQDDDLTIVIIKKL